MIAGAEGIQKERPAAAPGQGAKAMQVHSQAGHSGAGAVQQVRGRHRFISLRSCTQGVPESRLLNQTLLILQVIGMHSKSGPPQPFLRSTVWIVADLGRSCLKLTRASQ